MRDLNEKVVCKDGFSMSVQANEMAYCTPKIWDAEKYWSVEVGFPSSEEPLLAEWAEDKDNPTDTVYGYVPARTVELVCIKHQGVVSGELPPGVIRFEPVDE